MTPEERKAYDEAYARTLVGQLEALQRAWADLLADLRLYCLSRLASRNTGKRFVRYLQKRVFTLD